MEESRLDGVKTSNHASKFANMDLLSLTFRSLDLGDSSIGGEELRNLENNETSMQKDRFSNWTKKDISWTSTGKSDEFVNLRTINLDEVAWHDTADNCWIVIYDFVYDCTDFLKTHPGGSDVLLEYAGRDATLAFIGTGHSSMAKQSLDRYLIGELPAKERIFRIPGGVNVSGF